MQQLTQERVERQIHAFTIGRAEQFLLKARTPRVEYITSRDAVLSNQEIDLLLIADEHQSCGLVGLQLVQRLHSHYGRVQTESSVSRILRGMQTALT